MPFRSNHPKKRLGQHFLTDPNTARIVSSGVTQGDVVLEIGPGRGFLTSVLAEKANLVHAVELDPDVLPALHEAVQYNENVRVYEGDALRFDYDALEPRPNKLVANLPYNVASPLILMLLEEATYITHLRFMVQLEVARRMAAARGTKDYAAYAVLVGLLAHVRIVHKVSPNVFDPPPRVYSAVVDMERREMSVEPAEYRGVKELVLAGFKSRRKRLLKNLPESAGEDARLALASIGLGPNARAEELRPEDFVALYRAISEQA
ncbi:MAG TPA: 16S rRNA (adenine(1518)-N(6)/adenine(1519)-N(6))-dimethyltransferase RsmA [Rubrobacteraceae bacterium]|nr:16S rRNA (adenine(1518)-N(6)/adenine(1519)-N(6))-dimethyltransferase RsmA [Rubrobacteraceae bacterium]